LLTRRDELSDQSVKTVVRIQNATERANRMVKDLLDFTQSRLAGGIPIHPVATDLHALSSDVLVEIEATHPDRVVHVMRSGNGQGVWDPDRLGQVLQNLVTNALRYSPADSPVQVSIEGDEHAVAIAIHNAGAPIPGDLQANLFEPFQRGASVADPTTRSVGLGLYIVNQIVRAHHGTVDVHSTASDGTTFIVKLPRTVQS
jgi:signal transduction histidine kinase